MHFALEYFLLYLFYLSALAMHYQLPVQEIS